MTKEAQALLKTQEFLNHQAAVEAYENTFEFKSYHEAKRLHRALLEKSEQKYQALQDAEKALDDPDLDHEAREKLNEKIVFRKKEDQEVNQQVQDSFKIKHLKMQAALNHPAHEALMDTHLLLYEHPFYLACKDHLPEQHEYEHDLDGHGIMIQQIKNLAGSS